MPRIKTDKPAALAGGGNGAVFMNKPKKIDGRWTTKELGERPCPSCGMPVVFWWYNERKYVKTTGVPHNIFSYHGYCKDFPQRKSVSYTSNLDIDMVLTLLGWTR